MSNEKPMELTEAEREELERSLRWHFAAHAEQPNPGYAGLGVQNAVNIVARIVAAREAAARREALLEAAEEQERLSTGPRALGNKAVRFKRMLFANWLRERAEEQA